MKVIVLTISFLGLLGHIVKGDDQSLSELSAASSEFSQSLYQRIALDKPNAIYSPYSIHSALTMTSLGARGDTADEMSQTLRLMSLNGSSPHQAYHDLILQMNSAQNVELNTANAIFMNPNQPIEQDFVNGVTTDYLATTANFDLAAPGGPEKIVNDYVANKTENMIKDILPGGSIDANTVMILVNTIFFNGTWQSQFEKFKTRTKDFQQLNGVTSQIEMMQDARAIKLKRDNMNAVDIAELPFKGGRFGVYIALPQKLEGIAGLEKLISIPGKVNELFEGLANTRVQLAVPKFKIETKYDLNANLKDMGMVKAFDPFAADFSGISRTGNVYISQVLHKAMIDVQESGTVAAAATAIGIKALAILNPPTEMFIADHPFVFFLRDNLTKQILFQGKFSG